MIRPRRCKCRNCGQLYEPDPRNRWHQRYCSHPTCRAASKAASRRRWRQSPKGRDYFKGNANVLRVQAWRRAHPGYWKRPPKAQVALQDQSSAQLSVTKADSATLTVHALQDLLLTQSTLITGLIAQLTGSALQDQIDATTRRLIGLGRQLQSKGAIDADQTDLVSPALTPRPPAVQLDRSPPGWG